MLEELKQFLSKRRKQYIRDAGYTPSAVLVPVYCKGGEYHLLFTKRTETVPRHKGEISFPGGAFEKSDADLLATALRESTEEIGLKPSDVEVLGELDDNITTTSNYVISPFVAFIPYPYEFKIDGKETEEIIEAPIRALLDRSCMKQVVEYKDGKRLASYIYDYQGRIIHGATARILNHFLGIWVNVVKSTECGLE